MIASGKTYYSNYCERITTGYRRRGLYGFSSVSGTVNFRRTGSSFVGYLILPNNGKGKKPIVVKQKS